MHQQKKRKAFRLAVTVIVCLIPVSLLADEYSHYYSSPSVYWHTSDAWVRTGGGTGIPGEYDTANVFYGIKTGGITTIGTLNQDTYISWGPAPKLDLIGGTLNIINGGQWMWGGFTDYDYRSGTVNQYGTLVLVDDIADHFNNGPEIVNTIEHGIEWGITFNNYGTMRHEGLGTFILRDNSRLFNYGTYDFIHDGSMLISGENNRIINYGNIVKSGGVGNTQILEALDNRGNLETQSGTITINRALQLPPGGHSLTGGQWTSRNSAALVFPRAETIQMNEGHVVLHGPHANLYTYSTYVYTPIEASLLSNEGTLEIYGDRTLSNAVTNTGTLKCGGTMTLTGDIVNAGTMAITDANGVSIYAGVLTQSAAGSLQVDGPLQAADSLDIAAGILTGTGSISFADAADRLTVEAGAVIDFGRKAKSLSINGAAVVEDGAVCDWRIGYGNANSIFADSLTFAGSQVSLNVLPYGPASASGDYVLFTTNGISGDPAWTVSLPTGWTCDGVVIEGNDVVLKNLIGTRISFNYTDFAWMAASWRRSDGDALYNDNVDFVDDGTINLDDLLYLSEYWLNDECCQKVIHSTTGE